jgi:hypothetical protein
MTPLNNIQTLTYSQAVKECFLDFIKSVGLLMLGVVITVTPILLAMAFGMLLVYIASFFVGQNIFG